MLPYCFSIIIVLTIEIKGIGGMLIDANYVENALYLLNFFINNKKGCILCMGNICYKSSINKK